MKKVVTICCSMAMALLLGCGDDAGPAADGPRGDAGPSDGPGPGTEAAAPDGPVSCTHPAVSAQCAGDWCTIPAGCFWMGSPTDESCREQCWGGPPCPPETRHAVTLSRTFEIRAAEVTQAEFEAAMGYNPSFFSTGDDAPVEMVSWHEAAAYCNALSQQQGLTACYDCTGSGAQVTCQVAAAFAGGGKTIYDCPGIRLPTEAEWEYAYRAGTTTALYNGPLNACESSDPGLDAIGWYFDNAGQVTHAAKGKQPNAWGLYDMAGNVWEWCNDWYENMLGSAPVTDPSGASSGSMRSYRGGSCWSKAKFLRAAVRDSSPPGERSDYVGFRVARTK